MISIGNLIFRFGSVKASRVASNSMQPAYEKGDIIFYKTAELKIGDVILFRQHIPMLILSRIITINNDGSFQVKGDANSGQIQNYQINEKEVTLDEIAGKVIFKINGAVFYISLYSFYAIISFLLMFLITSRKRQNK